MIAGSQSLGVRALPRLLEVSVDLTFAYRPFELHPARNGAIYYDRRAVISVSGVTSLVWIGQGSPGGTSVKRPAGRR